MGYIIKSLWRRRKEVARVCLATFLAMFFVSSMLAAQESLYRWQMAKNKEKFGDWFVMVGENKREICDNHPYFGKPEAAYQAVQLYEEDMKTGINYYVGSMTDDFIELGNITIAEGHFPEKDNEIAMDYNTLLSLGYPLEVGQEITLRYYVNNVRHMPECARDETYILSGILSDYTNIWRAGAYLPGVVVTEEKAHEMNSNGFNFLAYPLKTYVKTSDYNAIYDGIQKDIRSAVYNKYVYDFTPWGSEFVYNYLYVLIIIIGVVAIIYQMNIYCRYRKPQLEKLHSIGASKSQLRAINLFEKMLIIFASGTAGIGAGLLLVRTICGFIEKNISVEFFYLGSDVYIKSIVAIVVAYFLQTVMQMLLDLKLTKKIKIKKTVEKESNLSAQNAIKVVEKRLKSTNGMAINIGIRVFGLIMTGVIVLCTVMIVDSYNMYVNNDDGPDIVGFLPTEKGDDISLMITYEVDENGRITEHYEDAGKLFTREEYINRHNIVEKKHEGRSERKSIKSITLDSGIYCRRADTNIFSGYKQYFFETLAKVPGIKEYSLSSFETNRRLSWENMDYERFDLEDMRSFTDTSGGRYVNTYFFATDYISPDRYVYDRLSQYMDEKFIDYDAFERGDQVIVVVKKKPDQSLDTTIKAGDKINYHYLHMPIIAGSLQNGGIDVNLNKTQVFSAYRSMAKSRSKYISKISVNRPDDDNIYYFGIDSFYFNETNVDVLKQILGKNYDYFFSAIEQPTVAAVIKYSEEFEKEFADICADYGYYTCIASKNMIGRLIDSQNEFAAGYYGECFEPEGNITYEPNQISISYELSSAYSSTHNMVRAFFDSMGVKYLSNYDRKAEYRNRCLNAFMQYGITIIAAIVVNICICLILLKNRLEKKKDRMKLLSRLGMTKKELFRINMREVLREELWCIFTLPIQVVIAGLMIRGFVKDFN